MSLFDSMKDKVAAAGKEAKKLTKLGQLKLDLTSAETALSDQFKALGKACANRLIDRGEPSVEASDEAIEQCLKDIRQARQKVQTLRDEYEATRVQ